MNYCPGCGLARPAVADVNYCPGCGGSLNPAAPIHANLSGWWPRVGATLLDGLFVLVLNAPTLGVAIAVAAGGGLHVHTTVTGHATYPLTHEMKVVAVIAGLAYLASALLYAPLLLRREGRHNGQTWGKQLLSIWVIRDSGAPVDLGTALLREVVAKLVILSALGFVPIVGSFASFVWYLWPLWDGSNRAPHDMIAHTHVLRT
jgi:uncharacterized RDD family membrane protein YckC